MQTWLITGCSSGLGRSLAAAALARGHNVVVTARRPADAADLAHRYPDSALVVELDVTDASQVSAAVAAGTDRFGAIDVLVNNAGYGYRAAVEEAPPEDVRMLFDTHVFAIVSLINAVLPQMRARRSGTIVNISSIGVQLTLAGSGYYAAAKAAVEAITGSLRKEVEPLGITAFAVEPGSFRTDFAGRSLQESVQTISDYNATAGQRRRARSGRNGAQPGDPDRAADAILQAVESGDAPELLLLGPDAVRAYRKTAKQRLDSVAAWEELSTSTDFTDADR